MFDVLGGGSKFYISEWITAMQAKGLALNPLIVDRFKVNPDISGEISKVFIDAFVVNNLKIIDLGYGEGEIDGIELAKLTQDNMPDELYNTFFDASSRINTNVNAIELEKKDNSGETVDFANIFQQLVISNNFEGMEWIVKNKDYTLETNEYILAVPYLNKKNPKDAERLIDIFIKYGVISKVNGWDVGVLHNMVPARNWFSSNLSLTALSKIIKQCPIIPQDNKNKSLGLMYMHMFYKQHLSLLNELNLSEEESTLLAEEAKGWFLRNKKGTVGSFGKYGGLISDLCSISSTFSTLMFEPWEGAHTLIIDHMPNVKDVFFF